MAAAHPALSKVRSWMDLLRRSMQSEFPWWGNLNYTHGAMRATGLTDGARRSLLFETLVYAQREGELQRNLYAFDPARGLSGHVHHTVLVAESDFVEVIDEHAVRSRVTGVISRSERAGRATRERILVPRTGVAECFEVQLEARSYRLPIELPPKEGLDVAEIERWRRLLPEEVVLFQLVERARPNDLFAPKRELKKQIGLPARARTLFTLASWQHPRAPDDDVSDLEAMVRGLLSARKPQLSASPNCDWRLWLDHLLASRQRPSSWWGSDGEVFDDSELGARTQDKPATAPAWLARGSHPTWDAFGAPCAAMRATGFATDSGPALLIEAIVASRRLNQVSRETYAYGPGATAAPPDAALTPCHVLVPVGQIHHGEEGTGPCRVARGEVLEVELDGRSHVVTMSLPIHDAKVAKLAERAFPAQVLAYRLAEELDADALFAGDAELAELAGMSDARRMFAFSDWQHVRATVPLSKSADLVAMAVALEAGSEDVVLTGKPSGGWRSSVTRLLRQYGRRERALWP